ncbi:polysaccharide biosynthesis/export family protein [Maioricimonas sp. JC845]|uniref:polysaccharide biosynthesis/export family protein n=1 Tax=Maioricimonas sp. JC845 TaxID=3232138 RepID=UPI0034574F8E
MMNVNSATGRTSSGTPGHSPGLTVGAVVALAGLCLLGGCAAVTFPETGVPVNRVPDELLAPSKDATRTINLSLLRQDQPKEHLLAPGDVLGIWVEGVFGARGDTPPVRFSTRRDDFPSSTGLPFTVSPRGTVDLPVVGEINVDGMTLAEVKTAIRKAYVDDRPIIRAGFERIIVTLVQPREYEILVLRQETGTAVGSRENPTQFQEINRFKRGTGYVLTLPAYENDVLHALTYSGGLPGVDALNEVRIQKRRFSSAAEAELLREQFEESGEPLPPFGAEEIRIPLRTIPGTPLPITKEDIILEDGDVVFIEARESEVYYTGGLLPTNELPLPRDHDLDVLEAIILARGPVLSGGLLPGSLAFSAELLAGDIGGPSPTHIIVLRKTQDGRQFPIRVDLNKAIKDPRERIVIQPNDVVLMQQTPEEAIARYATNIFNFQIFGRWLNRGDATGTMDLMLP